MIDNRIVLTVSVHPESIKQLEELKELVESIDTSKLDRMVELANAVTKLKEVFEERR